MVDDADVRESARRDDLSLLFRSSPCPFAQHFVALSLELDLATTDPTLPVLWPAVRDAVEKSAAGNVDGFAVSIRPGRAARGRASLESVVLVVLRALGELSEPPTPVTRRYLHCPTWWFVLDHNKFAVLGFTTDLPPTDTRWHPGDEQRIVLVFQHENAFRRRFPDGIPRSSREHIKGLFRGAGRPYDAEPGVLPAALA